MSTSVLEVDHVVKRYGHLEALRGVTFDVGEGELFGLLGPNGAGKTTLLSIISCAIEPSEGCVRLFGQTVTPSHREVRRLIGIVPQELAIYDQLTARENLAFFGSLYDIQGSRLDDRVNQVLQAVGLFQQADQLVQTFSGGMKRRLNLGAALVHEPRLLLLDEPTTGVDPQSRNHIFSEVRRMNAHGMTVVYTSHYMEEVQALCQRIGIIDHGRLITCDELPKLLQQLHGSIHFRVNTASNELIEAIQRLPGVSVLENSGVEFRLACQETQSTLPRLVALLSELQLELVYLETEEPNLERVFLHLTGRDLRD
ncbi:MAG: ABC transporter ATP-binding protein [Gemmatales bacterium]|nr:MAG: ABC transporter ATP-binding protein [Gemmatales bacterium]